MSDTVETELIQEYKIHIKNLRLKLLGAYELYKNMCGEVANQGVNFAVELRLGSFERHLADLETQLEYHKKALECLEGKI